MIGMKEQCFGVEIEMTGVTREEAAQALADYFRTTPRYYGHTYDSWTVQDPAGKKWKLMSDASIHPECQGEDGYLRLALLGILFNAQPLGQALQIGNFFRDSHGCPSL